MSKARLVELKIAVEGLRTTATASFTNDDEDTVTYIDLSGQGYYLVNTIGNIQKGKSTAKDGNDWYFYTKDGDVKLYASDKNLKDKNNTSRKDWEDYCAN